MQVAHHYNVGDVVLGNWKLIRLLGEGSFGKVYEAHRDEFGTIYKSAIKIITIPYSQSEIINARAEGMDDESIRNYFQEMVAEVVQEFALMSKLKGTAHIVSYEDHSVIPHEDSIGWDILIRMELLTPMLNYVSEHQLSRKAIVKMGIDICKALELCQRNNIIHRDIKPENMFISSMGDFKLGDFGVARTLEKTTGGLSKKGTYTYMSPEVYREDAYGQNVDIYSLGIVMYRLLNNNRSPFLPMPPHNISHSDRELALIRRMSGEAFPKPANASGKLAEIVLKACAYDPKERYATASQMRRDLESLIHSGNSEPVALKQANGREESEESSQTRRTNHPVQKSGTAGSYSTHQDRAAQEEVTYRTSRTERTARENTQGKFRKDPERVRKDRVNNTSKKKKRPRVLAVIFSILLVLLSVCGGILIAARSGKEESVRLPELPDQTNTINMVDHETNTAPEMFAEATLPATIETTEPTAVATEDPITVANKEKYNRAEALLTQGETLEAVLLFRELGDFEDSIQRSFDIQIQQVNNHSTISTNGASVALKTDGTAIATGGDDWYNQWYVSNWDWKDIVSISAGGFRTLALRTDGTVVNAGWSDQGKYVTTNWSDIIAVSAGGTSAYGLKADGTVLATGPNYRGENNVGSWSNITAISAGFNHVVGLTANGTVVATGDNTFGECDVGDWTDIVAISAGNGITAALKGDGSVESTKYDTYGWTDIVAVSAGSNHILGLKADGTVVSAGNNLNGECNVSDWTDIIAISAGNVSMGLKADGTVVLAGQATNREHNVNGWSDIRLPY